MIEAAVIRTPAGTLAAATAADAEILRGPQASAKRPKASASRKWIRRRSTSFTAPASKWRGT